jgi:hypothetical protein
MDADNLFDFYSQKKERSFRQFLEELKEKSAKLVEEMGFPEYSVRITENTTKTETNYPVEFVDIPYPFNEDLWKDKAVCTTIATLSEKNGRSNFNGSAEIKVADKVWESVRRPSLAASKPQYQKKNGSSELAGYKVYIDLGSDSLVEYLLALIRHHLENYSSPLPKFGCCHLYEKCSAAGKCLQKSRAYSGACSYNANLVAGRNFYAGRK